MMDSTTSTASAAYDDVELAASPRPRPDSLRSVDLSSSRGGEGGPVDNVRSAVLSSRASAGGSGGGASPPPASPGAPLDGGALTSDAAPDAETFAAWSAGDFDFGRRGGEGGGLVGTARDETDRPGEGAADPEDEDGEEAERPTAAEARMRSFIGPDDETTLRALRGLRARKRARSAALLGRDESVLTSRRPGDGDPGGGGGDLDGASRGPLEPRFHYGDVDYTPPDSAVWRNFAKGLHDPDHLRRKRGVTYFRRILAGNWRSRNTSGDRRREWGRRVHPVETYVRDTTFVTRLVVLFVGFAMSVSGYAVQLSSDYLLELKIRRALEIGVASGGYAPFALLSLLYGLLAYLPVSFRPLSAGSGIAEAKAILNGIVLPGCTDLTTALCKGLSVVFAGAASLPAGLEGPMIFMGLSIGANGRRLVPGGTYLSLHDERFGRDLACVGTSCGVASAFLSPVGGVLFAMEEGASYWTVRLAWRAFGGACATVIFMYFWTYLVHLRTADADFSFRSTHLGKFSGVHGQVIPAQLTFHIWDFFVFAAMGTMGGVVGALWCEVNRLINLCRNRWLRGRVMQCLVILLNVLGMATLVWFLPSTYSVCGDLPDVVVEGEYMAGGGGAHSSPYLESFRQFDCPVGQYNHLATLLLNSPSRTLNLLYWEDGSRFSAASCAIAGTVYLLILMIGFGTSIAQGIFIPLLYVGACYGRAFGLLIGNQDVQCYAIVCSVAQLSGVARVLISITAIMMTSTGLPQLVTPFMVATIFARVSGKWLLGQPGIYDIILEAKGIPFLEETPPRVLEYHGLKASDVMTSPVVTILPQTRVGDLLAILNKYEFILDFVVTDPSRGGRLVGLISRDDLINVLSCRELFFLSGDMTSEKAAQDDLPSGMGALKFSELTKRHFRLGEVEGSLGADERDKLVNLTPYVQIAQCTFDQNGSASRLYELFRLLGLRTMVITGGSNGNETDNCTVPVGVVQRHDLKEFEHLASELKHIAPSTTKTK
mmetsp:Transcript_17842/g.41641  ORF Transcript_17842/g.41641 Transcript_17842/m.41641 type:complete len:996 (-) Transcript_17842:27-3014(-)